MNFKKITLREKLSSRGGGIEIDLTTLGFKGHKMSAYQNYLGGGMLGSIATNNTVRHANNTRAELMYSDAKSVEKLDKIADKLARHFHELTNHSESTTFEENQKRPSSAY